MTRFSQRQLSLAEQTAAGIQSIFDEARRNLLHISGAGGLDCLAVPIFDSQGQQALVDRVD